MDLDAIPFRSERGLDLLARDAIGTGTGKRSEVRTLVLQFVGIHSSAQTLFEIVVGTATTAFERP